MTQTYQLYLPELIYCRMKILQLLSNCFDTLQIISSLHLSTELHHLPNISFVFPGCFKVNWYQYHCWFQCWLVPIIPLWLSSTDLLLVTYYVTYSCYLMDLYISCLNVKPLLFHASLYNIKTLHCVCVLHMLAQVVDTD